MLKKITVAAIVLAGLTGMTAANAALYSYNGVVTLCTGTCASFASLDIGGTLTGTIDIDVAAGGAFGDADIVAFSFQIFNPALPVSGPIGDPVNDNPLILDSGLGIAASNGTTGTTDLSNEINSGQMLLEFLVPPFSSNGAFVVFDLATGNGQVCLFYATAGCIPGATQAVAFEGQFSLVPIPAAAWLFGSALLGLVGLRRRKV
ncbi:MAG: VPLPA-CTERM sorting domain-containing protein [Gammaproteobacteria bacterium]|nr:VPLPA-CTERM sorting domain-containing protein [Gammaproteobacteria bacterium]MBT8110570.1 VPLPA-CTERM sorting domain-containing protein [Gammaproteobacteria bacterium]NNL45270.1 VPLPA-CTERM sorting domain-containing protein [Woeseiaceae bacterium]